MQIDLPDETIAKAKSLAGEGEDAAVVIGKALDNLAWERQEVAAVMEGIEAYERGDHEPYEDFARRLFAERGLKRDP